MVGEFPGGASNQSGVSLMFLSKFVYCINCTSYENFKLQSHALGTHTKFQLEILTIHGIYGIVYVRAIILGSS